MKKTYIFDIDGCIMPVAFPKLLTEQQTQEAQLRIVREVNEMARDMKPYQNFFNFLMWKVKKGDKVYYITGRKKSNFGQLTYHQLGKYLFFTDPPSEIIFYPEGGLYFEEYYLNWKWIIVTAHTMPNSKNYVFDDATGYFPNMIKTSKLLNRVVKCFFVDSDQSWESLINTWESIN